MPSLRSRLKFGLIGPALLSAALLLAHCQPATPDGAVAETAHPGCPAPNGASMPTPVPSPRDNPTAAAPVPTSEIGPNPTTAPDVFICLGPWRLVKPAAATNRYAVTSQAYQAADGSIRHLLIIMDSLSGRQTQLGDQDGDASLQALSCKYVIWHYLASSAAARGSSVYIYDLQSSQPVDVPARVGTLGQVHVWGDWLTYMDNSKRRAGQGWTLQARNLVTSEEILLSQSVPIVRAINPGLQHDVNEDKVAWADVDPITGRQVIKLFDLSTRQTRKLRMPVNIGPSRISVSANYVIWSDQALLGWDLATDRIFSIPYEPPAWEQQAPIPGFTILARDNHVEWHLPLADADAAYHVVDIIRKNN